MSQLVFATNITVDGCCDHTKGLVTDEVLQYFTMLTQQASLLLYGRKTYELMVPYWPNVVEYNTATSPAMNDFARAFELASKVVFSRTLQTANSNNTRIVCGDLPTEILKVKSSASGDILVGGVDLSSQLITLGLVDEYRFLIHPVLGGDGARLLQGMNLIETLSLRLVDTKLFTSGHIALHYRKG